MDNTDKKDNLKEDDKPLCSISKPAAITLSICIMVVVLAFSLLSLVFMNKTNNSANNLPYEFIKSLKENWNLNYMTNIIATDAYTCPSGYEFFISNSWAGTKQGCLCGTVVHVGSCKSNGMEMIKRCSDVNGIDPIKFLSWNNKRVCVKRSDKNYLDLEIAEDICPLSASKKCGVIDSLGNALCVPKAKNCPINDLRIINRFAIYNTTKLYQSAILNDKKILYTYQNIEGKIPIYVKLSDEQPCINPKFENYFRGESYILDNFFKKETCSVPINGKREDQNYKILDSYGFTNILRENGIYNIYNKLLKLPRFPQMRFNHTSSIYGRGYYGMKITCRATFKRQITSFKNYSEYLDELTEFSQSLPKYISFTNVPNILQLVGTILWFVVCIFHKPCNYDDDSSIMVKFLFLVTLVQVVLSLVAIVFIGDIVGSLNMLDVTKLLYLKGCLDDNSESLLGYYDTFTKTLKSNGKASVALLALNLALVIIEFLIWMKVYVRSQVEQQIEEAEDIANKSKSENMEINSEANSTKKKRVDENDVGENVKLKSKIEINEEKEKEGEVTKTPNKVEVANNVRIKTNSLG